MQEAAGDLSLKTPQGGSQLGERSQTSVIRNQEIRPSDF
jgi:hypothetical protein